MKRLGRLDERSALAEYQRDQVALVAPLCALVAVAAVIGAPFAFVMGPDALGVGLLVAATWLGLMAWAGFRLRRGR